MTPMFEAKVNDREPVQVAQENGDLLLNGKPFDGEVQRLGPDSFLVRSQGQTHKVYVLSRDTEAQTVTLKVNGKRATVKLSSEIDRLLHRLGLNAGKSAKASSIKAPMPGLIHSILVAEGQSVAKGEPVLILEAMKMENVIKSPADVTVAKISVQKGQNVDKGALLITFA